MGSEYLKRPWIPEEVEVFIEKHAKLYADMSLNTLDKEVHHLVEQQEQLIDAECLQLNAASNVTNPRAARLLASSIGNRPCLGYPGKKYNRGMKYAEQLEIILMEKLKTLFKANYAEIRVGSGALANLYVYMATAKPGDSIMAFSPEAAGHVTHHKEGAAGLYGLSTHYIPFNWEQMSIDENVFIEQARRIRPRLIIVGGSMCLFPYDLGIVRKIADEIGAYVMYDAAHMGGMIAGGLFQKPLEEGADVITGSTYKSFGGPPSAFIVTNSSDLAKTLDRIAFPGLTANFDLARTAALIISVMDLLEHGTNYAQMCVLNAQTLAKALVNTGCEVFEVSNRGHTQSHHLALPAVRYSGGDKACRHLEQANILACGIELPIDKISGDFNAIRIGTQEITRWGMTPKDMPVVADLVARVLIRNEDTDRIRKDVIAFRKGFDRLHFVRH